MNLEALPLRTITPREASIFACLTDAFVEPAAPFPEVRDTEAVAFLDAWLARAPRPNRVGFRALLYLLEVGPLVSGGGGRLRRIPRDRRIAFLRSIESARAPALRAAGRLAKLAASLGYYGDPQVLRLCGYDFEDKLARAKEARVRNLGR